MNVFFSSILDNLDFDSITFKNSLLCIRYLALSKPLNVQMLSLVNCLQCIDEKCLEHVMVVIGGQLAWSTLPDKETLSIYTYLTRFVRHRVIISLFTVY